MDDLSSHILNADGIRELEAILEEAFEHVEFIGELDVNEEAFSKIGELLCRECLFYWGIDKWRLRPATLVTSLVFSARYSNEQSRKFWQPYARDVWKIEDKDACRRVCATYFKYARQVLTERFGLEFPIVNWGDVVRPVYWHAIIPAYVRDDFAHWFATNLFHISGLSTTELSNFLKGRNAAPLAVRPLKNFLDHSNTHEIALAIISSLIAATELLADQQDPAEIRALFSSQIRRDLWDEYIRRLDARPAAPTARKRHVRLEWVWSFDEEDWVLRLLNLVSDSHRKPQLCICAKVSPEEALKDWANPRFDIWPEQQPNGQWRVREIPMNVTDQTELLDGKIYVYDDHGRCICDHDVPALPREEFLFYRITQQESYAVPVEPNQLTSGEILVSCRSDLQLLDDENQPFAPLRTDYFLSRVMKNVVRHQRIARYAIRLPLTIKTQADEIRVEQTRRRIASPRLSEQHRIPNTSTRVPPVYTSNRILANFPEVQAAIRALKIRVVTPARQFYEPFDEYAERTGEGYQLDLSQFIPDDRIGTYTFDITYDFRSRLASPIEVSVVPDLHFSDPGSDTFHPLRLPRVRVNNIRTETIESPDEATEVEVLSNGEQLVTWHDLRSPYCRLHIWQDDRIVPIEWPIQRIYAWFEDTALSNILLKNELDKAKIHFRGPPNVWLSVHIGKHRQAVRLNARGERTIDLHTDQWGVILIDERSSKVPLRLVLNGREWIIGTFVRRPQITSFEAEYVLDHDKECLLISTAFSETLGSKLLFEVINLPDGDEVARTTSTDGEDLCLLDCRLPDGKYRIRVFADGEELQLPNAGLFDVKPPSVAMEANYQDASLTVDYEIDNLRLGDYLLALCDTHGNTVFTDVLDPKESSLEASIDLLPYSQYTASVRWKGKILGSQPLSILSTTNDGPASDDSAILPSQSVSQQDSLRAWLAYLIRQRPEAFTPETLFRLATVQPEILKQYSSEELDRLWPPLARIADVNRNSFNPVPTWALINSTLLMTTNSGTLYWIHPERIAWRGLAGIGKIKLHTPQEGALNAYARWSMKRLFSSRLRVWMPDRDPDHGIYSELDELDMWPAYYDRLSGKFHGRRTGSMMPGLDRVKGTYLEECAHDYTLIVRNKRTERPLKHVYSPVVSIDRNFTQALLQRKAEGQLNSTRAPDITSAAGYRWATEAWYRGFADDHRHRIQLRGLADSRNIAGKLSNFDGVMQWVLRKYDESLCSGGLRFLKAMKAQVPTEGGDYMIRLDTNVLALGIILRSHSLRQQSVRQEILDRINMTEDQLISLLENANRVCPSLLEWALTWSEIFIVHSSA